MEVKIEYIQEFIHATLDNQTSSRKEKGNRLFEFWQDTTKINRFYLLENFESEEHARAHKETSHYQTWKEKVDHWMLGSRKSISCTKVSST